MVLLLSLIIASIILFSGQKQIRSRTSLCYLICTVISCMTAVLVLSGKTAKLTGFSSVLTSVLTKGGLSGALFIYVMYAGAVPSGSIIRRTVMPVRGELSIMASVLAIGHVISCGCRYFLMLFTQPAEMRRSVLTATVCSLLMIIVMVPLFITSFKKIRRRIKGKTWKKIQRPAYIFYTLLYLHILFFNFPSAQKLNRNAAVNVILYSIIFLSYAAARISRALQKKNKKRIVILVHAAACVVFAVLTTSTIGRFFSQARTPDTVFAADSGTSMTDHGTSMADHGTSMADHGTSKADSASSDAADIVYTDGKYTGAAIGYNGRLTVSVTIENGEITDVHLKGSVDDEPYITDAVNSVLPSFLPGSSGIVDTVSGATTSSHALAEAVQDALAKAAAAS